ncbi:hypothetical protein Riv7116_6468 [Rivularia sp. PCC 7116]|uniref:type IV pilin-like G/H family protein n=1 Tax=Rivularia sp. PCC 7116 TaxID=373994 RepID=UPI00029F2593|nr:type IV pilin-like G/H family protein [Rivularia sp. PCC 7116]AFY58798.1 hypothetical protein Riv7116_6468 [Rivularia sp. PCC 7116]
MVRDITSLIITLKIDLNVPVAVIPNKIKKGHIYMMNKALKTIILLLFLAGISGCKLFTGEIKSREYEGRFSIDSMNSAQQVYFLENNKFTTQLDIQTEIQNYDLKIVPQPLETKSIMHIAQAKRKDIKSYLGLVYSVKIDGVDLTIAQVCETATNAPLTSTPEMPKLAESATKSEDIKCPSGFQSLNNTSESR